MFDRLRRPADARLHEILSSLEEELGEGKPVEVSKQRLAELFQKHYGSAILAKAVTLKVLNLCLAKQHFLARSTELQSKPFGLIIDPSNGCNLACPGCVHSTHAKELQLFSWGKGLLPDDRLASFLKKYGPYAIHVNFCSYGEPLINPETPRYIRQAKGFLMQTMLSTNLSIGRFEAEENVASGLDYMLVSIDGATQEVYQKFRRNGSLEIVFRNLEKLAEAKRKLGRQTPVVAWRFLTFRHNVHEIPQAVEKARAMGVDQFLTLAPYDVSWDDPEIVEAGVEPVNILFNPQSEACILENWKNSPDPPDAETIEREFDREWQPVRSGTPQQEGITCQWLYRSMTLDAGGRIFPCCAAPRPDLDLVFASFDGEEEAFNSQKYRLARLGFVDGPAYEAQRGVLDPHCAKCVWNKDSVNTDAAQIRQYLKAAGGSLFNADSLSILSAW